MSGHIGKVVTLLGRQVQVVHEGEICCDGCVFAGGACPDEGDEAAVGIPTCIEGEMHKYVAAHGLLPNETAEASPVQSNTTQAHDRLGGVVSKL